MREFALELKLLFEPLEEATESLGALVNLLGDLGWELDAQESNWASIKGALAFIEHVDKLSKAMDNLINAKDDSEEQAAFVQMLGIIVNLLSELGSKVAGGQLPPLSPFDKSEFWQALGEDLFGFLVHRYLENYHPAIGGIFGFLGIITVSEEMADVAFLRRRVHFGRIPRLFHDIGGLLKEEYDWGNSEAGKTFQSLRFLSRLGYMARDFGADVLLTTVSEEFADHYYAVESPHRNPVPGLEMQLLQFLVGDTGVGGIWLVAAPIPPVNRKSDAPEGIVVFPIVEGSSKTEFNLAESLMLVLRGQFQSSGAIRLEVRPNGVTASFDQDLGSTVDAGFMLKYDKDAPTILIGSGASSNLQIKSSQLDLEVNGPIDTPEVSANVDLQGGKLIISGGEGDGFLQKILPPDGIEASFDFGIAWSKAEGLRFHGSGALEVSLPIHKSILDVIKIESIYLSIGFNDKGVPIKIGLTGGVELGPIAASIQRVGVVSELSFPEHGGNLGKVNIDIGFLPPTGAGLSINAGGIVGGGFIEFDRENERYAGILGLSFGKIGLTAIGLIATRMPDGSKGFSMLINIGVIFSPPIQLVMGFTLSGVGGLVGINRSMQIDVLRAGLKNRTLDSILFPDPKTVVANASKIISDSNAVFLPVVDRHIVAPMVKIGWGNNIITADIGIFIEFPSPIRIVLMGQVEANLPKPDKAVVVIHLDILGVLDIEKKELTFQATLYDSRILKYTLSGDSAFLLGWGQDRRFALSLGGFHPKFTPPPPPIVFADLTRLSLSLSSGNNFQISASAYQALTPNSLQFGARVELYASKAGATVTGHLGFDTLIYFSPFSFEVEISGGVRVKYKGHTLSEVDLSMTLSGPTPWNARGKVKFKLLGISIKKKFDFTWGDTEQATLPSIDPFGDVKKALEDSGNWSSALPANQSSVEYLRSLEGEAPGQIILHPAGQLEVRQNVVPLEVSLSLFGNAPIAGHDLFKIEGITIENMSLPTTTESVDEFFARGQYEQLTSQQKISLPSFEKMKGGVRVSFDNLRFDGSTESEDITYESIILGEDGILSEPDNGKNGELEWEDAQYLVRASAARKAVLRAGPGNRFSTLHTLSNVDVPKEEFYCIVKSENLERADLPEIDNRDLTRMKADHVLQDYLKQHSDMTDDLIVIPEYEVVV